MLSKLGRVPALRFCQQEELVRARVLPTGHRLYRGSRREENVKLVGY